MRIVAGVPFSRLYLLRHRDADLGFLELQLKPICVLQPHQSTSCPLWFALRRLPPDCYGSFRDVGRLHT
jgi:hypothetical protein